jgi:hypothetical protein
MTVGAKICLILIYSNYKIQLLCFPLNISHRAHGVQI